MAEVVEVERSHQGRQVELHIGGDRPTVHRHPVEAEIAEELVAAFGHQEDFVPAFTEVVVLSGTATHDIVASVFAEAGEQVEDVSAIAEHAAVMSVAVEEPVVALATQDG